MNFEKGEGVKLVLVSNTGGVVVFAEPDQTMPKLYKMTYERWVKSGKPETIYV